MRRADTDQLTQIKEESTSPAPDSAVPAGGGGAGYSLTARDGNTGRAERTALGAGGLSSELFYYSSSTVCSSTLKICEFSTNAFC